MSRAKPRGSPRKVRSTGRLSQPPAVPCAIACCHTGPRASCPPASLLAAARGGASATSALLLSRMTSAAAALPLAGPAGAESAAAAAAAAPAAAPAAAAAAPAATSATAAARGKSSKPPHKPHNAATTLVYASARKGLISRLSDTGTILRPLQLVKGLVAHKDLGMVDAFSWVFTTHMQSGGFLALIASGNTS